jgi:hypothetical protein
MALELLRKGSPERVAKQGVKNNTPIRYRDAFEVGISRGEVGGRPIPAASFDPGKVTSDATEAFIYNLLPFSRQVDVQLIGSKRIRFSIDAGLFDRVAGSVRRAFPALYVSRIYNVDFPEKYTTSPPGGKFHSPGLVIRPIG